MRSWFPERPSSVRDRLLAREDLIGSKPTPQGGKNRRLIDTSMRLFEDDMSQVRRAELAPDTEREKIAAPKPHSQRTTNQGCDVAQEVHPPIRRRGVIRQVDTLVEIHKPSQKRARLHQGFKYALCVCAMKAFSFSARLVACVLGGALLSTIVSEPQMTVAARPVFDGVSFRISL
jgi:hypothetical protein